VVPPIPVQFPAPESDTKVFTKRVFTFRPHQIGPFRNVGHADDKADGSDVRQGPNICERKLLIFVHKKTNLCRGSPLGSQMLGVAHVISGILWESLGVSVSFWE
jgi:hypothetical protein